MWSAGELQLLGDQISLHLIRSDHMIDSLGSGYQPQAFLIESISQAQT